MRREIRRYRNRNRGYAARRRQVFIQKIAALAGIMIIAGVVFHVCGKSEDKVKKVSSEIQHVTEQPEVKETQEEATEEETRVYPQKSEAFSEIVSEEVKSPYVALLDVENDVVLAGRSVDTKIYPASMTKVMTLIVAVEQIKDLNQTFTMTAEIVDPLYRAEASRAGFEAGDEVTAKDLLYGLILPSGADAAVALATMAAGSEEAFAGLMNSKCEKLGLKDTHFCNASGLFDLSQYTTPVEMGMILAYAMENETCAEVLSTYQYTTAPLNSNPEGILLTSTMFGRMYGTEVENVVIQAGKTGYTDEAGNCLVSYAEKNGHHYVALTAGAENRWQVIYDDFEIYGKYLP